MFCRSCGKNLDGTPKICSNCGESPVKGTSFCRYCGSPTSATDVDCPKCGAALKVTDHKSKGLSSRSKKLIIAAAVVFVLVYVVLATPTRIILRPIQYALSSLILTTTGYTANPLSSISADPALIPVPAYDRDQNRIDQFAVGQTQQLTISAKYTQDNSNGSGISKDVTKSSKFQSSNDQIVTVSSTGDVKAIASGNAFITVSYTGIPGSSNWSTASQGKIPVTLTTTVSVTVR
jgi:hypothetical protein